MLSYFLIVVLLVVVFKVSVEVGIRAKMFALRKKLLAIAKEYAAGKISREEYEMILGGMYEK